ncbi:MULTISPECIES: Crp/Fnr family transcriptional regulator [unclassified Beijerinckia]|uniref:Crp/Fnr family transcriptional regulator n=1 Tax=unclassified Beijerinckia TaxID=2638183 RepID=UPI0008987D29|nr:MULTISPECIES: Crp/Fnr family transcriptional regulator [unclassified Beijerinckia]MDH7799841.1 CRP/FNR family cyclic AMP-dependent transcriptional regulator [Beijerinckia sp. GAS462]SED39442.1 cAMP-binding domain of CRP or a regulatory subunit of cAMP-dependent protein kinases [Beijerinckia sp. 28-YEA-48]
MNTILIKRERAEAILRENGWLSTQPEPFRSEVLRRSILLRFSAGEVIYHFGDELGGIYGLVSGGVSVNTAPQTDAPQLIHMGVPGSWTGEDSYLIRQPRRLELRAVVETWAMYLSLDQMDQMTAADPSVIRNFCTNLLRGVDVLIRIIHDLQKLDPDRRIASVLHRMTWSSEHVLLTQTEVATMASASRRQVNATLKRFAVKGWVTTSYGSITVLNAEALQVFGNEEDR